MWLVTGSEGFIGKALGKTLGDFDDCDIENQLDACWYSKSIEYDVICHLAATSGIAACDQDRTKAIWNNVNTMAVFANNRYKRGIMMSSMAAVNPTTFYGATKAAAEQLALAMENIAIVRLSNVFGPGSDHKTSCVAAWCKEAFSNGTITVHGSGLQRRDFIYIDDVVRGIGAIARHDHVGTVSLCTGKLTPIIHVAQIISTLTGARIKHTDARFDDGVTVEPQIMRNIGWEPDTNLTDQVIKTVKYFEAQYAAELA